MARKKYLLLLIFFAIFLFGTVGFASALEVKLPGLKDNPSLPEYVSYLFTLLISVAGILSLISFAIGAVGLINPNVEAHSDAKDRMKNALFGLALTFAAFLILRTINLALVKPDLTPLPSVAGIFYTNGTDRMPVALEVSDTSTRPAGYNGIIYDCTGTGSGGSGPTLLLWKFPKTGLEGGNSDILGEVNVKRVLCGVTEDIGGIGSFKMAFETPGVYYCYGGCNGEMCSGYMSGAISSSQDNIGEPFNQNLGGVRIVNNPASGLYYGTIFHKETGLWAGGECSLPVINTSQGSTCENVDMPVSAVNVFTWASAISGWRFGFGVTFFSEPHGSNFGAQKRGEGFCTVLNSKIVDPFFVEKANKLIFGKTNSPYFCGYAAGTIAEYKNRYKTFKDKPESIYINGNYMVVLYGNDGKYCQVFSQNIYNANVQPFVATGHSMGDIYIIPIK